MIALPKLRPLVNAYAAVKQKDLNDEPMVIEVENPLVNQTNVVKTGEGSYPHIQGTISAGNTPGKSSYANVIGESSKKAVNILLENALWFIRNHPLILCKWNPDVDLLKEDIGNVAIWVKLHDVPITMFNDDGLSAIAMKLDTSLMLDSYTSNMCLQSWTGVANNLKKPSQTFRGVPVGPKVVFKPNKEYRPVPKKLTASPSGNKKKGVAHTNEVSNSNPFDVLNLVYNNVEFYTNGWTTNFVNNGANSSGSSFMNVKNNNTSCTPIIDKIKKFKDLLIDRKDILVDEVANPLKKVECPGDYDSEDEVASVDNDMAHSLALERDDLPQEIQAICDNLDIQV
nr:hypothetical protein [Tanacetum cinerariifolium]